jgi:Tfp pilus assembly protein PilV
MNVQEQLAETEVISGKHPLLNMRIFTLWEQMSPQQQKHLAQLWAQLLRQMQLRPDREKGVQNVED